MNPNKLFDSIKLIVFEMLTHWNVSPHQAFDDRDFVVAFVNRVFEKDGADDPDKRINCIKATRSATGLGLQEAKAIVERFQARRVNYNSFRDMCDTSFRGGDRIDPATLKNMVDSSTSFDGVDIDALKADVVNFIVDIPF